MEEIWKDVPGYENLYQVSTFGRVKSVERCITTKTNKRLSVKCKILSINKRKNGYCFTNLWKNNKMVSPKISRLVALAFIPNPENKPTVNHKDGNKANNTLENLEWATLSEQIKHSYDVLKRSRLGRNCSPENDTMCKKVLQYSTSGEFIREYVGIIIASKTTGINYRSISGVANNHKHRKTAGGFVWKFK